MMAQLNPYLNFENNCREAMMFYRDILGGDLELQTVADMPEMAAQMPPHMSKQILHSKLTSGNIVIMASDLCKEKPIEGNTFHLCINCDTNDQLTSFFTLLSAGGKVTDPLADMPWGGRYGALTDKFGKHWIFNYQKPN